MAGDRKTIQREELYMQTAGESENWTVEFIRADGEDSHTVVSAMGGFATRGDAEYYGQCLWAGPQGRGVKEVRVRREPRGEWRTVAPASVCGAVRI
jgi:hypothetical protein